MRVASTLPVLVVLAALASGSPPQVAAWVPAEVRALRDVRVPAEVRGRVVNRPEDESAAVGAAEVIVELDDVFLSFAAQAAAASATRAAARRDWARIEAERLQGLYEKKSIGKADLDRAWLAAHEAEASHLQALALSHEAARRLDRAKIRAPFAGKLVRIYPETGEFMQVGETAFRIIDDSGLRIIAYLPPDMLPQVRPGSWLQVRPDGPDTKLPALRAKVFSVAPAAEGAARTFRVEARVQDKSSRWRPGMTARIQPLQD